MTIFSNLEFQLSKYSWMAPVGLFSMRQVDSTCLGVESLTKRLVSLLTVRIKDALPNMKWELQESLSKCYHTSRSSPRFESLAVLTYIHSW